jgi:hypothetical protein
MAVDRIVGPLFESRARAAPRARLHRVAGLGADRARQPVPVPAGIDQERAELADDQREPEHALFVSGDLGEPLGLAGLAPLDQIRRLGAGERAGWRISAIGRWRALDALDFLEDRGGFPPRSRLTVS